MRYALIYISWLGTWAASEIARYSYEHGQPLEGNKWVEIARFMIFFSVAAFAFLAADKNQRTISYQVQIEHIVFIVGAKAIQHFFAVLSVFGIETFINPYLFSYANYVLAGIFILFTPIRISYIKRKRRYDG